VHTIWEADKRGVLLDEIWTV